MGTVPSYEDEEEWMMVRDLPVGEACVFEVVHRRLLKSLLLWKKTNKHLLLFKLKVSSLRQYVKLSEILNTGVIMKIVLFLLDQNRSQNIF